MELRPNNIKAAQRGIWFFMRTIVLAVALFLLGYGVFVTALRASNLYILATEGLSLRAECILKDEVSPELREYFTENFITEDKGLNGGEYADYTITGFDYRVQVEKISVLPYSQVATVTITERMVALIGTLDEDKKPANAPEGTEFPPPQWQDSKYQLRFTYRNGRFYANQLKLIELAPEITPKRTPNMNMTPILAHEQEPE